MTDPRIEISDPATPPARLAELAQQYPELGPYIAAHPNAYPELQEWIAQYAQQAAQQYDAQQFGAQPYGADQYGAQPYGADQYGADQYGADQYGAQPSTGQQPWGPEPGSQQYDGQQSATQAFPTQPFPTQPLPAEQFPGQSFPSPATAGQQFPGQPQGVTPQAFSGAPQTPNVGKPGGGKGKKVALISVASVLAVLLAVGGGLWWYFGSKLGGSANPEAAATKLVGGLSNMDPLALYGSIAPSEFSPFEGSVKELTSVSGDSSGPSIDESLSELRKELTITANGIETDTENIADGVERVSFVDGEIVIDGDRDAVVKAVMRTYEQVVPDRSSLNYIERDLRDNIDLPYTIDFRKLSRDARDSGYRGKGLSVVTVQENGAWYVSPILTVADAVYLSGGYYDDMRLGTEIVAPKPAAKPEAALEAIIDATVGYRGDTRDLAELLPLAERRLISIYGNVGLSFTLPFAMIGGGGSDAKVIESKFSSASEGGRARIKIDALEVGSTRKDEGYDLFNGWRVEGLCFTNTYEYLESDSSSYFGDSYFDDDYTKEQESTTNCLTDFPIARDLGFDKFAVIAVEENGGWLVSPLATYGDAASIVSERVVSLSKDGKLERTIRDAFGY